MNNKTEHIYNPINMDYRRIKTSTTDNDIITNDNKDVPCYNTNIPIANDDKTNNNIGYTANDDLNTDEDFIDRFI